MEYRLTTLNILYQFCSILLNFTFLNFSNHISKNDSILKTKTKYNIYNLRKKITDSTAVNNSKN